MMPWKVGVLLVAVLQTGCSVWSQKDNTVLIREPDESKYTIHTEVRAIAKNYWEYIALATNAYHLSWPNYQEKLEIANNKSIQLSLNNQFALACQPKSKELIPTPEWSAWTDFPPQALADQAEKAKLFFSVWEHHTDNGTSQPEEIAIVFRGTEADQKQDWFSNARWFIPTWLRGEDQYDITRDWVSRAFDNEILDRIQTGRLPANVKITAIGHSLGGGLAQQLAYAMPRATKKPVHVSKVIAFNSSPVTGWFSTNDPPRNENTRSLAIDRVFEHGEALAYIRLPINLLVPPNKRDSAVRDLRFNLNGKIGGIKNHGSQFFACRLAETAGITNEVIHTKSFEQSE